MGDLQNTFSWSYSRHGLFATCARRYYLNHYGFWGGWEARAPADVREIYIQKQLTSLPMWIGTVVHEAAEKALKELREGRPWNGERLVALAEYRARMDIEDSREGRYRQAPKKYAAFQEHYYGDQVPASAWEDAVQESRRQVQGLTRTAVYRRLLEVPERLREVENLTSIDVGGVPVWVKLDALVEDGRGGVVVLDWKTGAAHDPASIARQLGVYGLYCVDQLGYPVDQVLTMYVNLRTGDSERHPVTRALLEETRAFVVESAGGMRARLRDVEANLAVAEDFEPLAEGAPECRRCNFRRSCGRDGAGARP